MKLSHLTHLRQVLSPDAHKQLLEIILLAYNQTLEMGMITDDMVEDDITERICIRASFICRSIAIDLQPFHQKSDRSRTSRRRGKAPAVDISFVTGWGGDVFFGLECRVLEETNQRLYKEYIDEGIERFVSEKYCSHADRAAMVGYVRQGDGNAVSIHLCSLVRSLSHVVSVDTTVDLPTKNRCFASVHRRLQEPPIALSHLLLDYQRTSH